MKFEIIVSVDMTTGKIEVTAPFGEKLLCYGLLEAARQQIQEYNPDKVEIATKEQLKIIQ